MIVCHCNVIAAQDIEEIVLRVAARDPHRIITPGTVFARCGKRPNCGGCMPLIVAVVAEARLRQVAEPRVRTLVSDPGGIAGLDLAPPAGGEASHESGGCAAQAAAASGITGLIKGARR